MAESLWINVAAGVIAGGAVLALVGLAKRVFGGRVPWKKYLVGKWYSSTWNPLDEETSSDSGHWRCDHLALRSIGDEFVGSGERLFPPKADDRKWRFAGRVHGARRLLGLYWQTSNDGPDACGTFQLLRLGDRWEGSYFKTVEITSQDGGVTTTFERHPMVLTRGYINPKLTTSPHSSMPGA